MPTSLRPLSPPTYPERRAAQQVWRLFQAGQSDSRQCEAFFEGIPYCGQTLRASAVVAALLGLWQAAPHTPLPAREQRLIAQWAAEYTAPPAPAAAQLPLFAALAALPLTVTADLPVATPPLDPKTLTAPRSRGSSTKSSTKSSKTSPTAPKTKSVSTTPASRLQGLAQANPGHILVVRSAPIAPPVTPAVPVYVAAPHTRPVNLTVYANGQTVITVADWGLELFRQTATHHNYAPDGNAVVTVVRRVDEHQPWDESNAQLDDQAEAFIGDLPYTGLHWHFQFVDYPLPEQYTPARPLVVSETGDEPTGWDHIYTIDFEDSRADQLAAGDLVDVTDTAREAGFKAPVAVTRALWDVIEDIPPAHSYQSVRGRLWDLVSMAYLAARKNPDADVVHFKLIMHHENRTYLDVAMRCGPGDDAAPVITLLLVDEE